jgi:hypothetical protein
MSPAKEYLGERVTFCQLFEHHPHVEIPIIQRDYAQGRASAHEVRSLFLGALYEALAKSPTDPTLPLDLDFVYGSIEGEDVPAFCPLDGQQRLTTLFLLHWYLAWVDRKGDDVASFLTDEKGKSRFAYVVRSSSGEFLDGLVRWFPETTPSEVDSLSQLIEDQPWFFQWWKRDPTIQSVLAVLDAIHELFSETKGLFDRLIDSDQPCVTFHLLDLKNFGLSDDLYIKMNARGKPLTEFETFKAQLEKHIGQVFSKSCGWTRLGKPVSLQEYFSHQIDTTWADIFWAYRDKETNLFDEQVMNLVRALAIISRDPDADDAEEIFEQLHARWGTFTFQQYSDCGCLDEAHIHLFVTLLDALSGTPGQVRRHLPDKRYFDEERAFSQLLVEWSGGSYTSLIQFSAYAEFFQAHGLTPDANRFGEWMRVVRNLSVNSNIQRPAEFLRSRRSICELLKQSGRILEFLAKDKAKVEGFSSQQIREERIKAALLLKSDRWKASIMKAEQHGYFNGQIEFLLDFCGILPAWQRDSACNWTAAKDDEYFAKFSTYFEKANMLFGEKGLISFGNYRTERALLAIGDYTFEQGPNKSFLEDSDGPISWKRLLRGEQIHKAGPRREYFKELLNRIDVGAGARKSLSNIISTTAVSEEWRRLLAQNPAFIEFCGRRQIRYVSSSQVYLLRGVRRSGEHAELFMYDLCLGMLSQKSDDGELTPFGDPEYRFVHTDSYVPSVVLSCAHEDGRLIMQIWNGRGKYHISLQQLGDQMAPALQQELQDGAGCILDDDGDPKLVIAMTDIEATIDGLVKIVRKHVDG